CARATMSERSTARRSTPIHPSSSAPPKPRASSLPRASPAPATAPSPAKSAKRRRSTLPRIITSSTWRRTRSAIAGSAAPGGPVRWGPRSQPDRGRPPAPAAAGHRWTEGGEARPMQFGVQFFPDVRPEEKTPAVYFREALDLAEEADRLGYSHI